MSPRAYTLGKRAAAIDETRRRILDAAAAAYKERGIAATPMQEVARRADVAAGTVLYHFPSLDALARAVVAHITDALKLPTTDEFQHVDAVEARLSVLIRTVYEFWARSGAWVDMFFRERDSVEALRDGERMVMDAVSDLIRIALGPAARVGKTRAVVEALVDPRFYGALLDRGLAHDEAVAVSTQLATKYLERPSRIEAVPRRRSR